MEAPVEYVQNFSAKPVPEPYRFTTEEQRLLFNLQRRKHLVTWDEVYKRAPLTAEECQQLEAMERTIKNGTLIVAFGRELPFAPGQIYEVPRSYGRRIVEMNPERLRLLAWREVQKMQVEPTPIHFETVEEAKALIAIVASGGGESSARSHPLMSVEDDTLHWSN